MDRKVLEWADGDITKVNRPPDRTQPTTITSAP